MDIKAYERYTGAVVVACGHFWRSDLHANHMQADALAGILRSSTHVIYLGDCFYDACDRLPPKENVQLMTILSIVMGAAESGQVTQHIVPGNYDPFAGDSAGESIKQLFRESAQVSPMTADHAVSLELRPNLHLVKGLYLHGAVVAPFLSSWLFTHGHQYDKTTGFNRDDLLTSFRKRLFCEETPGSLKRRAQKTGKERHWSAYLNRLPPIQRAALEDCVLKLKASKAYNLCYGHTHYPVMVARPFGMASTIRAWCPGAMDNRVDPSVLTIDKNTLTCFQRT